MLVVTTPASMSRIRERNFPDWVQAVPIDTDDDERAESTELSARAILEAVCQTSQSGQVHSEGRPCETLLVEGGPQLMDEFFAEDCLDELSLTLAPQVAGRDGATERPGLIAGKRFAPERPVWEHW